MPRIPTRLFWGIGTGRSELKKKYTTIDRATSYPNKNNYLADNKMATKSRMVMAPYKKATATRRKSTEPKRIPAIFRGRKKTVKLMQQIAPPLTGNMSVSYYTEGKKVAPPAIRTIFKQNQKWEIAVTRSSRIDTDNYGTQAVFTQSTFDPMYTAFNADLDRALNKTTTANEQKTSKLYFGTEQSVTTYSNQEMSACYIDIYEITPRFHILNNLYSPVECWKAGVQFETDAVVEVQKLVYQSPFRSEYFTNFYKVHKIYRIELPPGGIHKHVSTHNMHKGLHGVIANNAGGILRGFTNYQMHVVSGVPINDKTILTNVSTSTVAVDVVRTVVYDYTFTAVVRDKFVNLNLLPAITTPPDFISQFTKVADTEA